MTKPLKRFTDRIGKRIYRNSNGCHCKSCEECRKNGIVVMNEMHAKYLHTCSMEMGIHYFDADYKDTPQILKDIFGLE